MCLSTRPSQVGFMWTEHLMTDLANRSRREVLLVNTLSWLGVKAMGACCKVMTEQALPTQTAMKFLDINTRDQIMQVHTKHTLCMHEHTHYLPSISLLFMSCPNVLIVG